MKLTKSFLLISVAACCLALTSTTVRAQIASGETSALPIFTTLNAVDGAWQINPGESDDVMQKLQGLLTAASGIEKVNAQQSPLPMLSISLFPPETLVVASGDRNETTINEGFQDVVQTRTFQSDGAARMYELRQGASISVTAFEKNNLLTIETVSPRGNRMIETYELANGGHKLKVMIRIESPASQELLTLHRVYDRLAAIIPVAEGMYQ